MPPPASSAQRPRRKSPLLERVLAIMFRPGDTWNVIAAEFTTAGSVYKSHVLPLALVPAAALTVGSIVWGRATLFGSVRIPITTAVQTGVATYVLWLVAIFLIALVVDVLASTFDGTANRVQAVKVAAYASTPALLAGAFALLPTGGWLKVVSVYGLYLLYAGLTPVMKSPKERVAGYAVVVGIVAIVLYLTIDLATQAFLPRG